MNFIQECSNTELVLRINAKPNSKIQKIMSFTEEDSFLSVMLRSKAVKNKANKELIDLFKQKFQLNSNQIQIISGVKNQTKSLKISFLTPISEKDIMNKLKQ
jgi:uncharacterized protein (TIGR00251 family)